MRALQQQVGHVVVVDDGSPAGSEAVLAALAEAGALVVRQQQNSGIAAALNAGVAAARAHWNPDFFLTLDQDSRPTGEYVRRGLATYAQASAAGVGVGFVTAASYSGHPIPVLHADGPFVHAFDPMQSGFLIPRSTVDRMGPFEEALFIDGVDSEFTMRTRAAGLAVLVGEGCDIAHDLGQREPGRLFGRPLKVLGREISYNYHSPSRVYYICRNGTLLTLRYLRKYPGWVLRRLVEETEGPRPSLYLQSRPRQAPARRRRGVRGRVPGLHGAHSGGAGAAPALTPGAPDAARAARASEDPALQLI